MYMHVLVCIAHCFSQQTYGDLSIACDFASCIQLTYIVPIAILMVKWFTGTYTHSHTTVPQHVLLVLAYVHALSAIVDSVH